MFQGRNAPSLAEARSLADVFIARCDAAPDAPIYIDLDDDGRPASTLSGRALAGRAAAFAARLAETSAVGDRILLLLPPGLDFVVAFWGCVLAGRVAVPVPSLDAARLKNAAPRLRAIALDAQAACVVLPPSLAERWLATDGLPETPLLAMAPAAADEAGRSLPAGAANTDPDATVYLQYTSGSTRAPRGVVIDAFNVLAQCRAIGATGGIDAESRILSWLPHHHDYGLVQGVLLPVCSGATGHLMSPMAFLRRPLRWLDAIARLGITHSGAPNFAYAACVRALAAHSGWQGDLRHLRSMSCGAEPIHAPTMAAFVEAFAPHGLSAGAISPAYGMAEAVLAITAVPPGVGVTVGADSGRGALVSCGRPLPGMRVRIVDPVSRRGCPEGVEGEIWVAGDSVGRGYWGDAALSAETFEAFDAAGEGPFLRTGDLGHLVAGELVVTGRLKDLLIVRGRNLHPQDIEWCAQAVDAAMRTGYGAAFAVAGEDGDNAVLVQELERAVPELGPLAQAVRRAVADAFDLPLAAVVFVRSGSLPRTSSGKIRRSACREAYLAGQLTVLHVDAGAASTPVEEALPRPGVEAALAELWRELLRVERVGRGDAFIALGGDSLRATQLASRIGERFGVALGVDWVLAQADLAGMAAGIEAASRAVGTSVPEACIPRMASRDRAPTSFSQRRMWLVQELTPGTTAYNMAFAFRIRGRLDVSRFAAALAAVADRHDVFRSHLAVDGDDVCQRIGPPFATPMALHDVSALAPAARDGAARAWLEARIRQPFDLAQAPLHHAHLVRLADDEHAFLWAIHHAIGDLWSFGVLLRELSSAYADLDAYRARPLARLDYVDFASWQRSPEREAAMAPQLERWCRRLQGVAPVDLPADRRRIGAPSGHGGRVTVALDAGLRGALKALCGQRGVTPFMALLAAYQVLLARVSGQGDVAVATPIANRHRLDVEGLVGTFVNTVVMRTELAGNPRFDVLLQRVRGVALEAYADQDAPFEQLVARLAADRAASDMPLANVMFNLVSVPFDALALGPHAIEAFDFDRGGAQFDLSLSVDLDVFAQVHLEYAEDRFDRARAEAFVEAYLHLLAQTVASPELPIEAYAIDDRLRRSAVDEEAVSAMPDHAADPLPRTASGAEDEAAIDALAQRLTALARELLPDAEADYSFFDAGGHSLLALRYARNVEDEFGVRLSLVAMARSSLRGLAAELWQAGAGRAGPP
ncbi:condensation domain-containing protein [Silanimonas sp.]|uniref:condensation domain-containing protein n=1 Tax=Silanimonas sp. TaxID=1929290 RepID=UPI00263782A8|nr:condensation domain-containing protein [Silanimonas sp.]